MVILKLDLTNVRENSDIPAGRYLAKLTNITEEESKQGNPMLVWHWEITRGSYKGDGIVSFTMIKSYSSALEDHTVAFNLPRTGEIDTDVLIGEQACLIVHTKTIKSEITGRSKKYPFIYTVLPREKYKGQ